MATQKDYDNGTAAAKKYAEDFVADPANDVPVMFQGMARGYISKLCAPMAKAIIDAVEAGWPQS